MIVAGIGSRRGVTGEQVLAAIDAALAAGGLGRSLLSRLATVPLKRGEAGIVQAARALDLPLVVPDNAALEEVATRAHTTSAASQAATGMPSAAEAAALAAAGPRGMLRVPRLATGPVTCAIAEVPQ